MTQENSSLLSKHVLALLRSATGTPYIHRDFSTADELSFLLRECTQKKYSSYPYIYLAMHGGGAEVCVKSFAKTNLMNGTRNLDWIADQLEGRARGKVIIFSACAVMNGHGALLRKFRDKTQAKAIMGYKENVNWLESAQFELALLSGLPSKKRVSESSIRGTLKRLNQTSKKLRGKLQFRVYSELG
ncbi:hypothetical protein FHP25_21325 [Vineibacter terrae]|uniref:CHAT domain-containing protein n=1 Tax=Vineibacter terrae TaxID=2586908 RepID=A0A5C8PI33_9HYPH|nr:hypothetical protein [Vineibacter terrae]TXL73472.1 hypothetical protein FHP25_21325 [Vineibacter terrae]